MFYGHAHITVVATLAGRAWVKQSIEVWCNEAIYVIVFISLDTAHYTLHTTAHCTLNHLPPATLKAGLLCDVAYV